MFIDLFRSFQMFLETSCNLPKPQTKKATQDNLFENAITKLLLYQGGLPDKFQS